ncbi:NAD(P)-binding protein [Fomitopsis serialis]|uniref:NAD(P)-binding protein n=1 Tax=Fomitopsis serialis TaxID=139415 RepID=UPI002008EA48|nr:NAD(P)-binding protein [Neoantrodia serialis]KAH9924028.1 NAD(P)-binding protein [Neoantrodia serialis]
MASVVSWLITGASRGLGLELARQLASTSNNIVLAACRNPSSASHLHALKPAEGAELHIVQLDVSSEESIRTSVATVEAVLNGRGLDYLYNNAGICPRDDAFDFSYDELLASLQTNVAAPALLGQLYAPLLEKGTRRTIVNVSSALGRFSRDSGAAVATYSVSKTAVNMLTFKQAKARPDFIVIALAPGWVKTDMGGAEAGLEPSQSVAGQLRVVLALRKQDSGKFLSYDGQELPW